MHQLGAEARLEGERVVVPLLVRQHDAIARIDEQVADQREAVGDRARDDRQPERLAAQRRVLGEHLLPPALAQRRLTGGRRVVEGLGGRQVAQVRRPATAGTSARRPRSRCRSSRSSASRARPPRPTGTGSPSGSRGGGRAPRASRTPRARRASRRSFSSRASGCSDGHAWVLRRRERANLQPVARGRPSNAPKPIARQKACARRVGRDDAHDDAHRRRARAPRRAPRPRARGRHRAARAGSRTNSSPISARARLALDPRRVLDAHHAQPADALPRSLVEQHDARRGRASSAATKLAASVGRRVGAQRVARVERAWCSAERGPQRGHAVDVARESARRTPLAAHVTGSSVRRRAPSRRSRSRRPTPCGPPASVEAD